MHLLRLVQSILPRDEALHQLQVARIPAREPLLAMLLEESLSELGHEVAGSAATVEQGLAALESTEIE